MKKSYTIGEIFRLGLLKNHKGEPYRDKATISRIINSLAYGEKNTPWGVAKTITKKQIDLRNQKYN